MARSSARKRSRATFVNSVDAAEILITSRHDEFSASSWWMVDVENDDVNQGASPLVKRCMRVHGWDLQMARRVLKAYRQFLFLKKHHQDWDATDLSPSFLVDQMWHLHILDVVNYCHDMMMLCGHVVGHNPDGALDIEAKRERELKTRNGLEEHFKEEYDKEIWGIIESSVAIKSANDEFKAEANPNANTVTQKTVAKDEAGIASSQHGSGVFGDDEDGTGASANVESDTDESCRPGLVDIEIRLRNTGLVTKYRVHRSTRLSGYFRAFAESQGKEQKDFVFRFNGLKIDGRKTFHSLKANSDDTLHLVATGKEDVDRALTIILRDQSNKDTFFRIKESTKMAIVFNSYAFRTGIHVSFLRFLLDGESLAHNVTPRELYLEDGDVIHVMLQQGGC